MGFGANSCFWFWFQFLAISNSNSSFSFFFLKTHNSWSQYPQTKPRTIKPNNINVFLSLGNLDTQVQYEWKRMTSCFKISLVQII